MRAITLLTVLAVSGCSSILGIEGGNELIVDAGLDAPILPDAPVVVREIFVAPNGSDGNNGSAGAPLRSLTAAVTAPTPGMAKIIRVAPGTYDAANGEIFPLSLAPGIEIFGPGATLAGAVTGPLVVLGGGSVEELTINNTVGDGVQMTGGGALRFCSVSVAEVGLIISSPGATVFANTFVDGNAGVAISAPVAEFEFNTIFANEVGIELLVGVAITTQNDVSCNVQADVRASGGQASALDSFAWDHVPPEQGNLGGGIDITTSGGSTVTANNPGLVGAPCP